MSADIMPCGCEGHMDNLELCRYPVLQARVAELEAQIILLQERALHCIDCKSIDDTVQDTICPYQLALYGHEVEVTLCYSCYRERSMSV